MPNTYPLPSRPVPSRFRDGSLLTHCRTRFFGIADNYAAQSIQTYYFNFLYNLDPNNGTGSYPDWPQWGESQQLTQFWATSSNLLADDFRQDSYEYIVANTLSLYV